jgi:hypothetical protein
MAGANLFLALGILLSGFESHEIGLRPHFPPFPPFPLQLPVAATACRMLEIHSSQPESVLALGDRDAARVSGEPGVEVEQIGIE